MPLVNTFGNIRKADDALGTVLRTSPCVSGRHADRRHLSDGGAGCEGVGVICERYDGAVVVGLPEGIRNHAVD